MNQFRLVDQLLGGHLEEILRTQRDQGKTVREIESYLREKDIEISRETIRRWVNTLGIEKGARTS